MKYLYKISIRVIVGCIFMLCTACSEESLCPDENHPHVIDLGLPDGTKWACCNVGAPQPEDHGGFYAWGETNVKPIYDGTHYQHGEVSPQIPQQMGNIAGSEYDVARARDGLSWQMPSSNQWQELIDYCEWDWVEYKGCHGWKITGPNGNMLFLPAGGAKGGDEWYSEDEHGYYWSADYKRGEGPVEFYTNGGCRDMRTASDNYRFHGHSVRPIANP